MSFQTEGRRQPEPATHTLTLTVLTNAPRRVTTEREELTEVSLVVGWRDETQRAGDAGEEGSPGAGI